MITPNTDKAGIEYSPGHRGKYAFRVRQTYVATQVGMLVRGRRSDAAKLDLVLRGLALLPKDAGDRDPGTVLDISYEALHDLVRDPHIYSTHHPSDADLDDAKILDKKRNWVREQLTVLEKMKLVERTMRPGRRPRIMVLKDDASGDPLDDPGEAASLSVPGSAYVTIPGHAITDPRFRKWTGRTLAAFLCAMTAEGRDDPEKQSEPGNGQWFRTVEWFRGKYRPNERTVYTFSARTIQDGLSELEQLGQLSSKKVTSFRGHRFDRPRKVYRNGFGAPTAKVLRLRKKKKKKKAS